MKGIEKINAVEAAEIDRAEIAVDEVGVPEAVLAFDPVGKGNERFAHLHTIEMSLREHRCGQAEFSGAGAHVEDLVGRLLCQESGGLQGDLHRGEMPGRVLLVFLRVDGVEKGI